MKELGRTRATQKGASLFAIIVVMTLLGIIILAGLKIAPAYMDNQVVKTAIENLKSSGEIEGMSIREIRTYVTRTMQTNGARFDGNSIEIIEEGGVDFVEVRYESRVEMFDTIDAVVKFDYRIEK